MIRALRWQLPRPPSSTCAVLRFSGFLARVFWLTAHIFFLIGFRNRAGATWYTGDGCRDQAG
jgi:hypothetical protein